MDPGLSSRKQVSVGQRDRPNSQSIGNIRLPFEDVPGICSSTWDAFLLHKEMSKWLMTTKHARQKK